MERYYVYQFDCETFVVGDDVTNREICVCGEYDDLADARQRANRIAELLNSELRLNNSEPTTIT